MMSESVRAGGRGLTPWRVCVPDDDSAPYFFNTLTGEAAWEAPPLPAGLSVRARAGGRAGAAARGLRHVARGVCAGVPAIFGGRRARSAGGGWERGWGGGDGGGVAACRRGRGGAWAVDCTGAPGGGSGDCAVGGGGRCGDRGGAGGGVDGGGCGAACAAGVLVDAGRRGGAYDRRYGVVGGARAWRYAFLYAFICIFECAARVSICICVRTP